MQDEKSRISKSISVVLATYNGERFIVEQLESLRNQTLQVDEVLISDDASADNTVELIKEFIRQHSLHNWRISVNRPNKGYVRNFMDTIEMASGKYIFLCDQDDIWVNTKVEIMAGVMQENKEINVLLAECANFSGKYNSDEAIFYQSCNPKDYDLRVRYIPYSSANHILKGLGCCMCFKKDFFNEIKEYGVFEIGHDLYLWGFANFMDSTYKINFCSIYRRCHDTNTSWHEVKTLEKRVKSCAQWKLYYENILNLLLSEKEESKSVGEKKRYLKKAIQCNDLRYQFLTKKNIFIWLYYMLFFQKYNNNYKVGFLDLYLAVKKKWGKL